MGYKYKKLQRMVDTVIGAECDGCGVVIPLVFEGAEQGRDALAITLSGGYGEYYDGPSYSVLLCQPCADYLLKMYPCFQVPGGGNG